MMRLDAADLPIRSKPKSMHDVQRLAILSLKAFQLGIEAQNPLVAGGAKAQTEANRVVTEKSQRARDDATP
jgi:hypothetical protein